MPSREIFHLMIFLNFIYSIYAMYPVHKILCQEDIHRYAECEEKDSKSLILITKYLDSEEKNKTLQQMEKKTQCYFKILKFA